MDRKILKKGLVFGIMILFVLTGSVPSIIGKIDNDIKTDEEILKVKFNDNAEEQKLGIRKYIEYFLFANINITLYGNYKIGYEERGDDFFNVWILPKDSNEETPICKIYYESAFLMPLPFERIYLDYFNCNIILLKNPKTNLTKPADIDGGYIEGNAIILITRGW